MIAAHTRFRKQVKPVPTSPNQDGLLVLRSASGNRKVGKGTNLITKGRYRGMRLFALTLEERATCPATCENWATCYGDGSFNSVRWAHGAPLMGALWEDTHYLNTKYPHGFVVRLHILGDFYSLAYVQFWQQLFSERPALRVFGYTHWRAGTPIGDAVAALVAAWPDRCAILRSDGLEGDVLPRAMTVERHAPAAPHTIVCPEQTEATESCLTCGLCMNGRTSISFRNHHRSTYAQGV